jgi:hypothetical protein
MATSVLPDLPTTEDHLDFEASAATLATIIGDEDTATPITVGVFGTWGTGKTSLMRMVEASLIGRSRRKQGLTAHTIWFDAWKYDREQELWRALLMRVLEAMRAVAEGRPTSEHDEWPLGEKSPCHRRAAPRTGAQGDRPFAGDGARTRRAVRHGHAP